LLEHLPKDNDLVLLSFTTAIDLALKNAILYYVTSHEKVIKTVNNILTFSNVWPSPGVSSVPML